MGTVQIKDPDHDYQLKVNADGSINTSGSGPTGDVNLIEVGGSAIALGQAPMAQSLPVAIASDQSPLPIAGSISGNVNLNGLPQWQVTQYAIGTSAVQLFPTPLAGRSSISVKVVCTGTNFVAVGNDNTVTTSTGYPLFNGDVFNLDLDATGNIWAISTSATGQSAYGVEAGS